MNTNKLKLLKNIKTKLKNNEIIQKIFKKYDVDISNIDLIPIMFGDLDVSARCAHGIIYINSNFLEKPEEIDHYLSHEITHWIQQCFNDKPTKGSNDANYLDNKYEQEGFKSQTEYISDTRGDQKAEKYIDKVLDHHDIDSKKEREKRKKQLLQLASKRI